MIEKEKKSNSSNSTTLSWNNADLDFFSDLPLPSTTVENKGIKRKLDECDADVSINESGKIIYVL